MTANLEPAGPRGRVDLEVWVRRGCTLIVAVVAPYSSYEHQRGFALHAGADPTNAALWPLSELIKWTCVPVRRGCVRPA